MAPSASSSSYATWQPLAPSFAPASPPRAPTPSSSSSSLHSSIPGTMASLAPSPRQRHHLGHVHTHSVASSSSHSQAVYHPQPTRSGRLPVPPRQEEINAMLSMENYFEFPSESESDDEDFVPPPPGVENEDTPQDTSGAAGVRASPGRNSKGKRKASNQDIRNDDGKQQMQNDAGYSSATEIGTIDNAEWEWLMDQMNSIENNGGMLPPINHTNAYNDDFGNSGNMMMLDSSGGAGGGNASEADADEENGSSPAKEGDFLSPVDMNNNNDGGGGFYSSWPFPGNVDSARTIFSSRNEQQPQHPQQPPRQQQQLGSAFSHSNQSSSTTHTHPPAAAAPVSHEALPTFIPYTKKPPPKKVAPPPPAPASENPDEAAIRFRAANGKFTKVGKRGKNKPVYEEKYPTSAELQQARKAGSQSQSGREESVISLAESSNEQPPTVTIASTVNPYTTIVPRKRGRAKQDPLSPRAEAAQAELRHARHLEQCEDYRSRSKMKKGDWEKRIQELEEVNGTLLEENKVLRYQLEAIKEERAKDRKALIEANTKVVRNKNGGAIVRRAAANQNERVEIDDNGEGEKENNQSGLLQLQALRGGGKVAVSLEELGRFAAAFMNPQKQQEVASILPSLPQPQQLYQQQQQQHQQQAPYQQQEQGFAVPAQQHGVDMQAMLGMYGQYAAGQK